MTKSLALAQLGEIRKYAKSLTSHNLEGIRRLDLIFSIDKAIQSIQSIKE